MRSEALDQAVAILGAYAARATEKAARIVLNDMLPPDRFSVVAADELVWINPRTEWTGTSVRFTCDGVEVKGARLLL